MKKTLVTGTVFAILFSGMSLININSSIAEYNDDAQGASESTDAAASDTSSSSNSNSGFSSNSSDHSGSNNGAEDHEPKFSSFQNKLSNKATTRKMKEVRLWNEYRSYIRRTESRIAVLEAKQRVTLLTRKERALLLALLEKRDEAKKKRDELAKRIGATQVVRVNPVGRLRTQPTKTPTPTFNPPIPPAWQNIKDIMNRIKEARQIIKDPLKEAKTPARRNLRPAIQNLNRRTNPGLSFPRSRSGFDDSTRQR